MPTPSGLLKAGDRIEYVDEHIVCTVKERRGNALPDYSVVLTRVRKLEAIRAELARQVPAHQTTVPSPYGGLVGGESS